MKEFEVMNNKNTHAYMQAEVNMLFTHMHAKKRVKLFGERDISALIKEPKQLDEGDILGKKMAIPFNLDEIIDAERRKAIEAVNLIKEKINGTIKVRTSANGIKQEKCMKEG